MSKNSEQPFVGIEKKQQHCRPAWKVPDDSPGGIGLFMASGHVSRSQWQAYVEYSQIRTLYPGVQGMGFSKGAGKHFDPAVIEVFMTVKSEFAEIRQQMADDAQ